MNIDLIKKRLYAFRGYKVMLDRDLAEYYGVETKRLNEAVKRNIKRFPAHFMFQLTDEEKIKVKDRLSSKNRFNPFVFSKDAALEVSNVLNLEHSGELTFELDKLKINEKVLETYIARHPEVFLGEQLKFLKSQFKLINWRPDLIFKGKKEIVIVEVQLGELDRNHFYKVLEYRDLYRIKNKTSVRVILFCNGVSSKYLGIAKLHGVDLRVVPKSELESKINIVGIDIIQDHSKNQKKPKDIFKIREQIRLLF